MDIVSDSVCSIKNIYICGFIDSFACLLRLFKKHVFDVTVIGLITLIIILAMTVVNAVNQRDEHKQPS